MSLIEELKQYCHDVLNDKPLSCKKHKWACIRFLDDIEKQGTEEFPYIFIPEKAERFFKWCSLFKHRKGILAGKFIELEPIHKFIFGNVYGWYNINTMYRRFNKLYWQVARKNTKSQMLSLVASYECMAFDEVGVETNEVYCAATKREQARIVYDETKSMLNRCKTLKGKFDDKNSRITHHKSESFIRTLSEEDKRTGDGFNPQCGIIDEYHAHETDEAYNVIDTGMGARGQPLLAIITTAGFNLEYPCYRLEYKLVAKLLDPDNPFTLDNYFVMINELDKDDNGELIDDIKDEKVWIKANPIVCTYEVGIAAIRKALKESLEEPEKLRNFLTKRLNIWVHLPTVSYFGLDKWGKCQQKLPDLKDRSLIVGIDLSSKIDLSSVTFEIPYEEKYIILNHSFMPEETFQRHLKTDKVPYDLWVDQGWLTVIPGAIIDYRVVIQYIKNQREKYEWQILEWCFDPWSAGQVMSILVDEGEVVTEIRQGSRTLSEPTKDFRDMVLSGNIIHDGNPVLANAISNAVIDEVDKNKNIMLNKKKSTGRIDPIVATINAHTRAMVCEINNGLTILVV